MMGDRKQADTQVQTIAQQGLNNFGRRLGMNLKVDSRKSSLELRDQRRNQIGIDCCQCSDDQPASLRTMQLTDELSAVLELTESPFSMFTKKDSGLSQFYGS